MKPLRRSSVIGRHGPTAAGRGEKLGMRLEQTIPHHIWLGCRWRDTHVFSVLAEEAVTAPAASQRATCELVAR